MHLQQRQLRSPYKVHPGRHLPRLRPVPCRDIFYYRKRALILHPGTGRLFRKFAWFQVSNGLCCRNLPAKHRTDVMHPGRPRILCVRNKCHVGNIMHAWHVCKHPGSHIMYTSPGRKLRWLGQFHVGDALPSRGICIQYWKFVLRPLSGRILC